MNAVSINVNNIKWLPSANYPAGAEEKVLSIGGDMTPRSILLKIPAGWMMDAHSHVFTELHYVLEGSYESQGKTFDAGTYSIIPKEVEHGSFSTKTGATILIIWCKIKE